MKFSAAVVLSVLSGAWRSDSAVPLRGFEEAGQEQGHRRLPPAEKILVCHNGMVIDVSVNALSGLVGKAGAEVCVEGATCGPDGCECDNPILDPILANGIDPAVSDLGTGCPAYKWIGVGGNQDENGNELADGGGWCLNANGYHRYCRYEMDSYEEAKAFAVSKCDAEDGVDGNALCIGFTYDILGCGCPYYFDTCDPGPASVFCNVTSCWFAANVPGKFSVFTHYSNNFPSDCVQSSFGTATGPIVGTDSGTAPITCPGNDNAYSCHCKVDGNGACVG